ncbi:MAG: DUF2141 domain-containing protein [Chakrabartia sp.]
MRRSILVFAALALSLPFMGPGAGAAQALGPNPGLCDGGAEPAILVKVSGLKNRNGKIRVRTFTGDPDTYFNKKYALKRLEYPTPAAGPVEICVPVSAPGVYAVDIRHDANDNGDTDRSDGVGASGNPKFSLWHILFGKKPPAQQVQIAVGRGTTIVAIQVRYL